MDHVVTSPILKFLPQGFIRSFVQSQQIPGLLLHRPDPTLECLCWPQVWPKLTAGHHHHTGELQQCRESGAKHQWFHTVAPTRNKGFAMVQLPSCLSTWNNIDSTDNRAPTCTVASKTQVRSDSPEDRQTFSHLMWLVTLGVSILQLEPAIRIYGFRHPAQAT